VLKLSLSLNCKRVRIDVRCCLFRDDSEGDDKLREGRTVWESNSDTVAIDEDIALLLNAEATEIIARNTNTEFCCVLLDAVNVRCLMVVVIVCGVDLIIFFEVSDVYQMFLILVL